MNDSFTIEDIMRAVATHIKTGYPDLRVYAGENQQGTEIPCFFISLMTPQITPETGAFYMRDIGLDVVYLQERNVTNSNLTLVSVLEWLDTNMSQIPFGDSVIWTYERTAEIQDQDLHYKFHVKGRVYLTDPQPPIKEMEELNVGVKDKEISNE